MNHILEERKEKEKKQDNNRKDNKEKTIKTFHRPNFESPSEQTSHALSFIPCILHKSASLSPLKKKEHKKDKKRKRTLKTRTKRAARKEGKKGHFKVKISASLSFLDQNKDKSLSQKKSK